MYKLNLDNRILGKSIAEGDHIWGKTKIQELNPDINFDEFADEPTIPSA